MKKHDIIMIRDRNERSPFMPIKKAIKIVLTVLLSAVVLALLSFTVFYFSRFLTMGTIEQLTDYDDGYNLYSMTVKYDYSIKDVIDYGITDTQSYVDAVLAESLPLLPVHIELPSYGCSVYRANDNNAFFPEDSYIMGRNYDFKLDTSCMMVKCYPKDGYPSIAFTALNNISADKADESLKTRMACLTAPFSCLDGVNQAGVSIAVLTLDSEPTDQNTGAGKITSSLAIRLVLDYASTTQEAVDLLKQYDMLAVNGRDYHFFISDRYGDSRAIEYDCESDERTLVDTPIQAVTNFYAKYIDKVISDQRNGIYGHGKERYDRMMEVINAYDGFLTREQQLEVLQAAATEPNPENVTSNTQWSIIFNNNEASARICIRRHWNDSYWFGLKIK